MFIQLGNVTIQDFADRVGTRFTDEEMATLKDLHRDKADVKRSGGFHIFDVPLVVSFDESIREIIVPIFEAANARAPFTAPVQFQPIDHLDTVAVSHYGHYRYGIEVVARVDAEAGTCQVVITDSTGLSIEPEVTVVDDPGPMEIAYATGVRDSILDNAPYEARQVFKALLDEHKDALNGDEWSSKRYRNGSASTKLGIPCPTCGASRYESCRTRGDHYDLDARAFVRDEDGQVWSGTASKAHAKRTSASLVLRAENSPMARYA